MAGLPQAGISPLAVEEIVAVSGEHLARTAVKGGAPRKHQLCCGSAVLVSAHPEPALLLLCHSGLQLHCLP